MSLCHSVSKKTLSLLVPMLFCLQNILCHYMSLCHSVSKKNSVITRHYVTLSLKKTLSLLVPMLFCLQNILTKTHTNV